MLTLYRIALYMALPLVLTSLLTRVLRNRRYTDRLPQRFGFGLKSGAAADGSRRIWIHAVSVGEVNAAIPLVKALRRDYPEQKILITTMTPTGAARVAASFDHTVDHCYLPYDYPGAVKRFLRWLNPAMAIIMETEIWPNHIAECRRRHIPVFYVNVRVSKKSYDGYLKFKKLVSQTLKKVDHFAVQSRADADRLIGLGAEQNRVRVTGSIKFELDVPAGLSEAARSVRRELGCERPLLVAGSTRDGEEVRVLEAFSEAKRTLPDLLLVLVPRHPERFSAVYRLCLRWKYKTVLRTRADGSIDRDVDIYVGDTMGELPLLIAAGDIAYIGGSLVATGGHNLLEACAAGVPVIFGPHMFNFQEIANMVLEKGAGVQVMDPQELAEVVIRFVNDAVLRDQYGCRGREFVDENRGALVEILDIIDGSMATRSVAESAAKSVS